jgi:imidazolonepropionase-like amidohydrolase
MPLALRCGHLIDGTGAAPQSDAVVVVDADRVTAVGKADLITPDMQVLDFSSQWVIPGLMNLHSHICYDGSPDPFPAMTASPQMQCMRATNSLGKALRAGVTTIREAGAPNGVSLAAKEAMGLGLIQGPRIFAAGQGICMTGGHGWNTAYEIDGPHEARKGVREQLKRGADVIKLLATGGVVTPTEEIGALQMTLEEMTAAVEEAHKAGKRVMAHAMGPAGIKQALEAGVDTIEHGVFFGEETVELFLKYDAWYVPTLSIFWAQTTGPTTGVPAHILRKAKHGQKTLFEAVALARKGGVKIAVGCDSGGTNLPHSEIALELELLLKSCGTISSMESIQAATLRSAEALGKQDDLGSVEAGKVADLVVLNADPLQDLAAIRQVAMVMKEGAVVHQVTSGATDQSSPRS